MDGAVFGAVRRCAALGRRARLCAWCGVVGWVGLGCGSRASGFVLYVYDYFEIVELALYAGL